mgnify:CR=1 FL=1
MLDPNLLVMLKKMIKEKNNTKKITREKIMGNKIYPIIFLVIIVLISVSLMMVVANITKAKILSEKEAEILTQLKIIFPQMQDFKRFEKYYEIYKDNNTIGYAFTAVGKGYGGDINILIGIDASYNIQAVKIISNTETPGLGTKITESSFTDQFKGLSLNDVNLSKDGGKVDAITGATISSKAVTEAVKNQMDLIVNEIKKSK